MGLRHFLKNIATNTYTIILTIIFLPLYYVFLFEWRMVLSPKQKVQRKVRNAAIIGAGMSGIVTARHLMKCGIEVVIFEKDSELGGTWNVPKKKTPRSQWDSYQPPGYSNLTSNTSGAVSHLAGLKIAFSKDEADIPHNKVKAYLQQYADLNCITKRILFESSVIEVKECPEGWHVLYKVQGECKTANFDSVIVCSGAYWKPSIPKGLNLESFAGQVVHAVDYLDNKPYIDKRVLVVGLGTTATDVATEVTQVSKESSLYCRKGRLMFRVNPPRYYMTLYHEITKRLFPWRNYRISDFVLPNIPVDKKNGTRHRESFETLIKSGKISVYTGDIIFNTNGASINGKNVPLDAVILATGYQNELSLSVPQGKRYCNTFSIDNPTMCFVGFSRTISHFFLSETQAIWIAAFLAGKVGLPKKLEAGRFDGHWVSNIEFGEFVAQQLGLFPKLSWRWLQSFFLEQYNIERLVDN